MRFIVTVGTTKFILDHAQLAALVGALDGAEQIEQKHVGAGKGTSGYSQSYIDLLRVKPVSEAFTVQPLPDSEYNTIKLVTASQSE